MLATDPLYISPEDYLAAEETSPTRYEYRDGEVFAMTGGTLNHNVIIGNLFFALKSHLRGSGCRIFTENVKTRIKERNAFYYPDLVISCDDRDQPSDQQYIEYPRLIIEVLSPSTARGSAPKVRMLWEREGGIVVMDEEPNRPNVIFNLFGKRESLANQS